MTGQDIFDRVSTILTDAAATRWASTDRLRAVNDAILIIIGYKPDAYSSTQTVTLIAGTKQALPATSHRLLDVVRNIRSDNSPGKVVTYVDRSMLDMLDPNWHMAGQSSTINHYVIDNREPGTYYVTPPAKAGVKLDIVTSNIPAKVADPATTLPLSDIYLNPLVELVLAKFYELDVEYSANPGLAAGHLNMALAMLGQKTSKDFAFSPDANTRGAIPNQIAISAGGVG